MDAVWNVKRQRAGTEAYNNLSEFCLCQTPLFLINTVGSVGTIYKHGLITLNMSVQSYS